MDCSDNRSSENNKAAVIRNQLEKEEAEHKLKIKRIAVISVVAAFFTIVVVLAFYADKLNNKYTWPENEAGQLVPMPVSSLGKLEYETADGFEITVYKMSRDEYNSYVLECQHGGFDIDYVKEESSFTAGHKNGYKLTLTYEGLNTVKINAEKSTDITANVLFSGSSKQEVTATLQESTTEKATDATTSAAKITTTEEVTSSIITSEEITVTQQIITTEEVTVTEELTTEEVTTAEKIITTEKITTTEEVTAVQNESRTVYITPTGKKYHYSASCAGKNAMARELEAVTDVYDPCKKCAS